MFMKTKCNFQRIRSNTFHAINKPTIENTELLMKSIYFLPLSSLRYRGIIPLPSNGGTGIRLKTNRMRFSENIMLSICERYSKMPEL